MNKPIKIFILFVTAFVTFKAVYAQQLNIKNYSLEDGLPQSQVFAIEEDYRGFIWIGTRGGGISCFDGKKFRTFTTEDGLINNFIYDIKRAKYKGEEVLLIATNNGLSVYNGNEFKNFSLSDNSTFTIYKIFPDKYNIWLATSKGVYYFSQDKLTNSAYKNTATAEAIYCVLSVGEYIWFGTDKGLHRAQYFYKQDTVKIKSYGIKEGLTNLQVRNIKFTRNGKILICTYGGGLFVLDLDNDKIINTTKFLPYKNRIIHDVFEDRDGLIWMATHDAGVMCWNMQNNELKYIGINEGLNNNHVHTIYQDKKNIFWFGTSGGGIDKYSREGIFHFNEKSGLKGNLVYAVCMDKDSALWIGTSAKGVYKFKNNTFIYYNADSGFVDEKVKAIFCDKQGNVWLGTEGAGMIFYDGKNFSLYNVKKGLSSNWIKDIKQDNKNLIWVATAGQGLMSLTYENNKLQINKHLPRNGFPERINCLLLQKDTVWMGTDGHGLYAYFNGKIKQVSAAPATIKSLKEFETKILLASDEGLYTYSNNITQDITKQTYINTRNIYLAEVMDNTIWAGTERGLYKITYNDSTKSYYTKLYTKEDGFLGIEACQNASHIDLLGNIWFGTVNGLTKLINNETTFTFKPEIWITGVNLFYNSLYQTPYKDSISAWNTFNKPVHFNYTENHVGFDFTALYYKNPSAVKYSWLLDGVEDKWSPLSDKNTATYINLPPGKYVFKVKACADENNCSENYAEFSFVIIPPYWQTLWFKLLVIIFTVLMMAGLIVFFISRSRIKVKRLNEKLQMQNKLLKLEQKALQLQMNPHFIFHTLNSINGLMLNKDIPTARTYLAKFSKLIRSILENSREELISLKDEIQTLENYLSIEKFTRNNIFDYEIKIDNTIATEEVFIPPMLLQPFLENSIIHGFRGIEHKGKIEIDFNIEEQMLVCVIKDNGVGRAKAAENLAQQEHNKKSLALQVVSERLIAYRNNNHQKSLEIIDLYENNLSAGTKVIVRIKID